MRAGLLLIALLVGAADSYIASIEVWRQNREERLKADDGWLTVSGLFWLKEGKATFGSDPSNDIVLPKDSVPPKAGVLDHRKGKTLLRLFEGPSSEVEMRPDTEGEATVVRLRDLNFLIIKRGERYGLRLRDKNSPYRKKFTHIASYPVDPKFRITARFLPHKAPRKLIVPSIIGENQEYESSGVVEFQLGGKTYRLEPADDEGELFFIFKDATSGKTTYPAGRFLYSERPKEGRVILDFNKAYNPPCAFTPYATCPLPPPRNRLPVAIEAGEKTYHIE